MIKPRSLVLLCAFLALASCITSKRTGSTTTVLETNDETREVPTSRRPGLRLRYDQGQWTADPVFLVDYEEVRLEKRRTETRFAPHNVLAGTMLPDPAVELSTPFPFLESMYADDSLATGFKILATPFMLLYDVPAAPINIPAYFLAFGTGVSEEWFEVVKATRCEVSARELDLTQSSLRSPIYTSISRAPANIFVDSAPRGADILRNGKLLGQTPCTVELSLGPWQEHRTRTWLQLTDKQVASLPRNADYLLRQGKTPYLDWNPPSGPILVRWGTAEQIDDTETAAPLLAQETSYLPLGLVETTEEPGFPRPCKAPAEENPVELEVQFGLNTPTTVTVEPGKTQIMITAGNTDS